MFEIFQYDFMVRAFIAGSIIAILAPTIGIFLVVRRYSLLADTLSHVSLVGVAAAVGLGINPVLGALSISTLAAIGIEWFRSKRQIFSESVLALFLSGSLAIALIILGAVNGLSINIFSYLFGSITTVNTTDLYIIASIGIATLCITTLAYRYFFLISYDENLARANKLPVTALNILLMILAAATVSLSMRVVGILLISALMVIPVLCAMQMNTSFTKTLFLSIGISVMSVLCGLFISFYLNLPSGATIVATTLAFFLLSLLSKK